MGTGAITQYIDVAQIALYVFWIFFAGLIYYLLRENKREGYPLESDRSGGRIQVQGFPAMPQPKTYLLRDGRTMTAPNTTPSQQVVRGTPVTSHLGSPLEPDGDPMLAAIGPGSYALRTDTPERNAEGALLIVPLRNAPGCAVSARDPDPRGLPVVGADGRVAGTVVDLWIDRAEIVFRYLEVELPVADQRAVGVMDGAAGGVPAVGRRVLLPMNFSRIDKQKVRVRSILASQFAQVPATREPDAVTRLEEDKIMGYYGGGTLYATPSRQEPLL